MRFVTVGLLLVAVTAISACRVPARAQMRSRPPLPSVRLPLRGIGTTISVSRACNRPLVRRGRVVQAFIQSFDSVDGSLVVSTQESPAPALVIAPPAVYQTASCLPIESHDGRRETLAALKPERFILLWVSDIVMPTQPPQFTLNGIEVFDFLPVAR